MITQQEMKNLVKNVYNNITHISIGAEEMYQNFNTVIIFSKSELLKNACAMYEDYSKATSVLVNGQPQFTSCGILNKEQLFEFLQYYEQYSELVEDW